MTDQTDRIGELVREIVRRYNEEDMTEAAADKMAEPLLELLRESHSIDESAFVEWQGVYEFGFVPICYDDGDHWIHATPDGKAEVVV